MKAQTTALANYLQYAEQKEVRQHEEKPTKNNSVATPFNSDILGWLGVLLDR